MTQAYNLSQLANNLNSSGQLDATDGLVNATPIANGGTGASTAAAARTNLGVPSVAFAVPSGGIIMWSGSMATIPSGWFLCNGSNGTPNLQDRFVVGAGNLYAPGASGGSKDAIVVSHTHTATVTDPGHRHTGQNTQYLNSGIPAGGNPGTVFPGDTGTATTGITVGISTAGSSGTDANLPPYYALAFIMKS